MKRAIMLAASLLCVATAHAEEKSIHHGEVLFNEQCLACHDAELTPPQAPPMFAVQQFYKTSTADRVAFIEQMTAFVMQPTEEKAKLTMAVQHKGVMPDLGAEEKDVREIAGYIYDTTFAPPCTHWKAAIAMSQHQGKNQQLKMIEQRYQKLCVKPIESIPTPSQNRAQPIAEAGTLKAVMQQLGRDYHTLSQAILMEDFEGAEIAALAIAQHEKPSMRQRMALMAALGTEMPKFKQADDAVHQLALEMTKAAKAKDMPQLIQHQSQLMRGCMACHTGYRQKLMNE